MPIHSLRRTNLKKVDVLIINIVKADVGADIQACTLFEYDTCV